MTTITQVFGGPRRGTFVALIIDSDKSVDLVAKYTGKFKYIYPIQTRFVNAVICSQWQIVRGGDGKGLVPSEDLYVALADASIHPGVDSLVPPVQVVNLNTILFGYQIGKRKPYRENLAKYYVPRFPEDPDSFPYRYIAMDPNRPQMSAQQCDELYTDVNQKRNFKYSYIYPKHHPFYLAAMTPIVDGYGSDRFAYVSNLDLYQDEPTKMPEQLWSMTTDAMRYRMCTKLIPMLGRGVFRDTPSRFGYKQKLVTTDAGTERYVRVTCTETRMDGSICGGHFLPTSHGDLACDRCGIIFVQNDIAVRRVQQSSSMSEAFTVPLDDDDGGFAEDVPYSDADTRAADLEYAKQLGLPISEELLAAAIAPTEDGDAVESDSELSDTSGVFDPDIDRFANIVEPISPRKHSERNGLDYYGQEVQSEFLDETASEPSVSTSGQLGTELPGDLQRIDARINDNLLIWKTSLEVPPGEETAFKNRLALVRDADREMRRKLRNMKLAEERKYHQGYSIYLNRWRKYAREFAEYRVLHVIRTLKINIQADIVRYFDAKNDTTRQAGKRRANTFLPLQQKQVLRAVTRLIEAGYLTREDNDATNRKYMIVTLTYIPRSYNRRIPRRAVYQFRDPVNRLSREPSGLYTHDIYWSLDEGFTHPL